MNVTISIVRLLAILLIVNQHVGPIYQHPGFAVGGHLGNSIFFFVSGWGLSLSFSSKNPTVTQWYWKRFTKLIIMTAVIITLIGFPHWQAVISSIAFHIIPYPASKSTNFIPNIVVLYALSYWLLLLNSTRIKMLLSLLLIVPAAIYFNIPHTERLIHYTYPVSALCSFLLGILTERRDGLIENKFFHNIKWIAPAFLSLFGVHAWSRTLMHTQLYSFYIALAEVLIVYVLMLFGIQKIDVSRYASKIFTVSSASLAVYLVHFKVIDYFVASNATGVAILFKLYLIAFALALPLTAVSQKIVKLVVR